MAAMSFLDRPPLSIDHLVLPTQSLATARARLEALGFTVAPEGVHPFGTRNACVYFADGTFLEPLAQGDAARRAEAERDGNVFVTRDALFRERVAAEGFSALVFATADASADHQRFLDAGLSAGDALFFSRPFADAEGRSDTASFRLAFAAAEEATSFFFTCERVNAPSVDRSRLESHRNGVVRIAAVTIAATDPASTGALVAAISGARAVETSSGVRLDLPNARVDVFGSAREMAECDRGDFTFESVTFSVRDLAATRALLEDRRIVWQKRNGGLAVQKTAGQGAEFIFEESV
ncbi:VOC family protein [Aquibium pacificus]